MTPGTPREFVSVPREATEALNKFAQDAFEIAWDGGDFDGGNIQDVGVALGLLIEEKFDPVKHGELDGEEGSSVLIFSQAFKELRKALSTAPAAPVAGEDALRVIECSRAIEDLPGERIAVHSYLLMDESPITVKAIDGNKVLGDGWFVVRATELKPTMPATPSLAARELAAHPSPVTSHQVLTRAEYMVQTIEQYISGHGGDPQGGHPGDEFTSLRAAVREFRKAVREHPVTLSDATLCEIWREHFDTTTCTKVPAIKAMRAAIALTAAFGKGA